MFGELSKVLDVSETSRADPFERVFIQVVSSSVREAKFAGTPVEYTRRGIVFDLLIL